MLDGYLARGLCGVRSWDLLGIDDNFVRHGE
jgi:hypothetical protein